ncbi:MAG: M48 family metallopeptidase [Chiayiivirga sp.]|jgi:predicted Zn-dependent protease|uniref:M48 family metallopeptidase n=1 Tax=Chiayiivirga sp. TaxID=2041042 RepID=UPI0025B9F4A4|nr:M48 family metallopeptidase [Chiayiivirga sp.]MCI1730102.1 M48 family metallopeptidase [Chiayiivirga sp.]
MNTHGRRPDPNSLDGMVARRRGSGIRWWVLIAFAAYAGYYYLSNRSIDPITGETVLIDKSLSIEQEEALGLQAYEEILSQERAIDPDSQVARQIRGIADRLIAKIEPVEAALAAENNLQAQHLSRGFEWDVSVIDSPQVNAFCLPGGKMAVYTGLVPVAKNADAMAVVMGHEISHALLRHGAQRMAREQLESIGQMAGAASGMDQSTMQSVFAAYGYTSQLPYARGHETQADEIGLMLAAAACFNPEEAVALWERMEQAKNGQAPPEFASTHPSSATRIENLQRLMPKAMQYRARFCGAAGG